MGKSEPRDWTLQPVGARVYGGGHCLPLLLVEKDIHVNLFFCSRQRSCVGHVIVTVAVISLVVGAGGQANPGSLGNWHVTTYNLSE